MTMVKASVCVVAATLFIAGHASPGRADTADRPAAEKLFREARALMEKGHYDEACEKFKRSQGLDPALGTLANLGECQEKIGKIAAALQTWLQLVDQLPPDHERISYVQERIAKLSLRVPKVSVVIDRHAPADTTVLLDGTELDREKLGEVWVDPGEHELVATAPGHEPRRFPVHLAAGERRRILVSPVLDPADAEKPEQPVSSSGVDVQPKENSNAQRVLGYSLGGAGAVSLIVAGVFAIRAGQKEDEAVQAGCNDTTCPNASARDLSDQGDSARAAASWAAGIGALALVGGAALVLTAPASHERAKLSVTTAVSCTQAGLQVKGAW